jgi:hypothetical protein
LRQVPDSRRKEFCAALDHRVALPEALLADRMMTWDHVREMRHAGIAFGSHTVSHPVVSRLTGVDLRFELSESKRMLESELGEQVTDFAFPFGHSADCGSVAAAELQRCGYHSAVTTTNGSNSTGDNLFDLRRIQVGPEHDVASFAFCLTQAALFAETATHSPRVPIPAPALKKEAEPAELLRGGRRA